MFKSFATACLAASAMAATVQSNQHNALAQV